MPDDISKEVEDKLDDYGYGYSYFSLKELKEYDWNQTVVHVGVIPESSYVEMKNGKAPTCYSSSVWGRDIVTVSPDTMDKILNKNIERNTNLSYYVKTDFEPVTYKECCEYFIEDTIPSLEKLVPKDGSEEDVRIIFAFDC